MKLVRILPFARQLLQAAVSEGDIVVDGTVGNGNDTVFLAELIGESGKVIGFDIQEQAIKNTMEKLHEKGLQERTILFQKGHEQIKACISNEYNGKITGAIFNLGYLPGGDKSIVTKANTTIQAVEQLLTLMAPEGIIVLVIYHGHSEGIDERDKLLNYVHQLDQNVAHVLQYQFINQVNHPPFIVAIEKRLQ